MKTDIFKLLNEIKKNKGIEEKIVLEILKEAITPIYKKKFGPSSQIQIEANEEDKEIKIFLIKKVVEMTENNESEIELEDAKEIDKDAVLESFVKIEMPPEDFGRIVTLNAKQNILQKIKGIERVGILNKYSRHVNSLMPGKIIRINKKDILVEIADTETLLVPSEQVKNDAYDIGKQYKFYVVEVSSSKNGLNLIISRSHPELVRKLFEFEVPEVKEGIVNIKLIAREPGLRSKIAVMSNDPNIDPIGACIGNHGMRVKKVINELRGEKVDIVKYSENIEELIVSSLKPSEVTIEKIDKKNKLCKLKVRQNEVTLAIGKEGQNVRLAAKLTGWRLDILIDN